MTAPSTEKQRIDTWIWHARFVKSRNLAQKLITSGKIRVNGDKKTSASSQLKPGDTLTMSVQDQIRLIRVKTLSTRRGPYSEAQLLYDDLSPPVEKKKAQKELTTEEMSRIESDGRPSKHQRRKIMQLKRNSTN